MSAVVGAMAGAASGAASRRRLDEKIRKAFPDEQQEALKISEFILAADQGTSTGAVVAFLLGLPAMFLGMTVGELLVGDSGTITGCFIGLLAIIVLGSLITQRSIADANAELTTFLSNEKRLKVERELRKILITEGWIYE